MFQNNKIYTGPEVAQKMGISYQTFRNAKKNYENHLAIFYDYEIVKNKKSICYKIINKKNDYIPYREFKKLQKNNTITSHIKSTIEHDSRQTGSNIARIIIVEDEVEALDLQLSTLEIYVRENLKKLIKEGYYVKTDYRWCYLDKNKNVYTEMSNSEVEKLRRYFSTKESIELEERLYTEYEEGYLTRIELIDKLGEIKINNFKKGRQSFQQETGFWPIKVPVYERSAF